jgi:hypothetical protein
MNVFEYGAGGSTLFIARRVRRVTSIEHEPSWYDLVAHTLHEDDLSNCDLRLIPAEREPSLRDVPYGPASYTSMNPHAIGFSFENYVRSIEEHPDRSFDVVVVDGYARFSCIAAAIPKVQRGGYLLFDDTDLDKFRGAVRYLNRFPRTTFVGVTPFQTDIRQTSVWRL